MLKKFYDTWYTPNNATLIIVGDVQPEHALALIKNHFGNIPAKKIPERSEVRFVITSYSIHYTKLYEALCWQDQAGVHLSGQRQ